MIDFSSKKIKVGESDTIIKKHFNLDIGLDCFVIISSNDTKFSDALSHKILDSIIDRITLEETYNDFSIFLENINNFIKTWKQDAENEIKTNIVISLLNNNNFLFSTT
jgi:exoribonuclease II